MIKEERITYMLHDNSSHGRRGGVDYETFKVKTSDGWELALRRYMPHGRVAANPVVLCHGLGANAYVMDFGRPGSKKWERYSLAHYLYSGGDGDLKFEVWVAELRGRNGSATFSPLLHPRKYNWCIDDYIEKDMPAIINFVRTHGRKGGRKPRIFWVGKSMGGMIAYAYGEEIKKDFAGVVTLSSPVAFEYMGNELPYLLKTLRRAYPRRRGVPLAWLRWVRRLGMMGALKKMMVNQKNIAPSILKDYIEKGMDNIISSRVFSHFGIFLNHRNFCRYPRNPWLYDAFRSIPMLERYFAPHSYKYNLRKFDVPLLAIAGGGDRTAPPEEVRYAYENVGSRDREYVIFRKGEEIHGIKCRADYGHMDLTAGRRVREVVYPVIYRWLVKRTRKRR